MSAHQSGIVRLSCAFCSRSIVLPPAMNVERFLQDLDPTGAKRKQMAEHQVMGPAYRCPRCKIVVYCSPECGEQGASGHSVECFDTATVEPDALLAAKDLSVTDRDAKEGSFLRDPEQYDSIARFEREVYIKLCKGSGADFEAIAFPTLFFTGGGHYGTERPQPLRYRDYRDHCLHLFTGAFKRNESWMSFSYYMQCRVERAAREWLLANRQGKPTPSPEQAAALVDSIVAAGPYANQQSREGLTSVIRAASAFSRSLQPMCSKPSVGEPGGYILVPADMSKAPRKAGAKASATTKAGDAGAGAASTSAAVAGPDVQSMDVRSTVAKEPGTCDWCNKPQAGNMCSRCKQARYCDVACQRAAYKAGHKGSCAPPAGS